MEEKPSWLLISYDFKLLTHCDISLWVINGLNSYRKPNKKVELMEN